VTEARTHEKLWHVGNEVYLLPARVADTDVWGFFALRSARRVDWKGRDVASLLVDLDARSPLTFRNPIAALTWWRRQHEDR
jgi:hypothetical protein